MSTRALAERKTPSESHLDDIGRQQSPTMTEGGNQSASKSLSFKLAFVGLACINFVFQFDATALGIALPTISSALGGTTTESLFANISYLLLVVVSTPIWTSVSDVFGRKPLLLIAAGLFFVGSIVFGIAPNMRIIIVSRALQGLGGGGIDVLVESIVADMTTLKDRSFWLGMMGLPIATGNLLGTPLGGVFAVAGWRWIGWINLPFIGVGVPLVHFFLRQRPVAMGEKSLINHAKTLDWVGIALSGAGIALLVTALGWAGQLYPWRAWQTLFPLLLGVALLFAFVFYEKYPALPIVPHRIYRPRTSSVTMAGGFIQGLALFSILQYLPLFYQSAALLGVLEMVVYFLPAAFAGIILSVAAMLLVKPIGLGYRWFIWALWIMATVGTGLLSLLGPESSRAMLIGIPVLWSAGVTALRLQMLPLQASVENIDDTNLAIGQLLTLRLFGGVVGLAISAGAFGTTFSQEISKLGELTGQLATLNVPSRAIEFIPELKTVAASESLEAVLGVYAKAFKLVVYIMTGFAGLGFIISLLTEELEMKSEQLGKQRFEER